VTSVPSDAIQIAALLTARGETLAVAETTAGGLISAMLTEVPGASSWFLGGATAYGALAKSRWLGLDAASFGAGGAVSVVAARLMADAVRSILGATWAVAETGIAGPQTGRRSTKPAGLAYIAIAGPRPLERELRTGLPGRSENQRSFATAALVLLREALERAPHTPPEPDPRNNPSLG